MLYPTQHKTLRTLGVGALALSLALAAGCSSMRSNPRSVKDSLLIEAPADQVALVAQAGSARDAARMDVAKAQLELDKAKNQMQLTEADLKTLRNGVAQKKLASSMAEQTGTTPERTAAKQELDHALAVADAARERATLRSCEIERARLAERLAERILDLREAEFALAKARAVQTVDRPEVKQISVRDHERQVNHAETEVAIAQARLNGATPEIAQARKDVEQAETVAASFKRSADSK